MREIRLYGSEGGGTETNRFLLPLSKAIADAPGCCKRGLCPPISRLWLCRVGSFEGGTFLPSVAQSGKHRF